MKDRTKIRANVKYAWNRKMHPNCKFIPGDKVEVAANDHGNGCCNPASDWDHLKNWLGMKGKVIAVTCMPDGKIRNQTTWGMPCRMYTKYYVEFPDKTARGFDACHLNLIK